MTQPAHLTDVELAGLDGDDRHDKTRVREHLRTCRECSRRSDEMRQLRDVLAVTGQRQRRPLRDMVPSAMMRLRLRRHTVTNANELLEGLAALMRGVISLFSLPITDRPNAGGARGHNDLHE